MIQIKFKKTFFFFWWLMIVAIKLKSYLKDKITKVQNKEKENEEFIDTDITFTITLIILL